MIQRIYDAYCGECERTGAPVSLTHVIQLLYSDHSLSQSDLEELVAIGEIANRMIVVSANPGLDMPDV